MVVYKWKCLEWESRDAFINQDAHKPSSVYVTRLLLLFDFFSYNLGRFFICVKLSDVLKNSMLRTLNI